MYEFFIAKRYLRSKHKMNFISIISILSTLGITIGVAALIIVLSVFNGFGSIVKSILINFDPHIRVQIISNKANAEKDSVVQIIKSIDELKSYSPYAEGKSILLSDNSYEVLNLKGIVTDSTTSTWGVGNTIIAGNYNLSKKPGELDKIILGTQMALRLSRFVGDTVYATSFGNLESALLSMGIPATSRFQVAGIFKTNNKEYDYNYVFTDIKSAQRLVGLKRQISGYEIRLNDIQESNDVKEYLASKLDASNYAVYSWYDFHKDLYDVMQIERWSTYVLLCLIIAVATFNILGSLTMSVIEKKKDIGILRAMGVKDKSILKIFMFEGLLIGILGTIAGALIGIGVCYLQLEFNIYPLDPTRYIIDALPIELKFSDIVATVGAALVLSVGAAIFPARRAVSIKVLDAIKWE